MAELCSVECGQILAATGATFKAVSGTILTLSARARTSRTGDQSSMEGRATRWKESGTLEKSHLPIRNTLGLYVSHTWLAGWAHLVIAHVTLTNTPT